MAPLGVVLPYRLSILALVVLAAGAASAQEMEPKAYSASPVSATFLVSSVARSTGAVVFDPTLTIADAEATINGAVVGVGTTFGLFGKLTLASAVLPYAWGTASGTVGEDARSVTRSGLADSRFRLSMNLRGNQAMRLAQFAKAPRRTIVGASLAASAPSGEYDGAKLINLGNNRWAFKPEVGVAVPRGPWDIDAYVGVWLFTTNRDFYPGGVSRAQDPVLSVQGHASYTFRPRLWLAVDATWYSGGATRVNDGPSSGGFSNSRLGATLSFPVGRQQSLKVAYSGGVAVRTGTNFRTIAVGWQWLWLRR
jgi:hypothetical protein